jgi:hypothetical protein
VAVGVDEEALDRYLARNPEDPPMDDEAEEGQPLPPMELRMTDGSPMPPPILE